MPFKSEKQKKFFLACTNPDFRKKNPDCPPLSDIKEFLSKEE